ncbi:O-antigen ligase family protein [Bosea sp. 124]|uniref:O-antigen ligase family protein n=1 Tax=Bosea sp. 124 TaxID=2135642 RepID=UPI000D4C485B|nr:O-antigen ligase family protein [Bosea sp. 124]PTM41720.1 O-antigen ligase-like membrane protein [Bosea sp. 124]
MVARKNVPRDHGFLGHIRRLGKAMIYGRRGRARSLEFGSIGQDARRSIHLLATGIVLAVVLLAPFPLASVEWRWIALWGILLAASTPFLDYSRISRTQMRVLAVVLAASAVLIGYMLLQTTGIGLLPEHRLFTETRAILNEPVQGYASVTPAQSRLISGGFALAVLAFTASFVAGSNPRTARNFLIAIMLMGILNGCLGAYFFYSDPQQLLWITFDVPKGQPSGTFVSRNHAVTLFASSTAAYFAIALQRVLAAVPRGAMPLKSRLLIMALNNPPQIGLPLMLFIVGLALTFATGSRGGLLALLAGLFTAYLLVLIRVAGLRLGTALAVAGSFLGIGFLSQVGMGAIGERFSEMRLGEDGRAEIYKVMFKMIADSPWTGFGIGSFEFALPQYRPSTISPRMIWDYAHSSPLQLIVELGIPAALLGFAILVGVVLVCIRGALIRKRDSDLPLIGASIGMVGLTHALIDFSLQIPGFMLVYASVLGAAAAQSFRHETHKSPL